MSRVTSAGLLLAGLSLSCVQPVKAGEISSLYTKLDLEKCLLAEKDDSGAGSAVWECKGHDGMRVRVAEGDLRVFVSYGHMADKQTATGETLGPFNTIHDTLEWRVERVDGRWVPFATILRFLWGADERNGETLVVTKLGAEDACHVGYVKADGNPEANAEARAIADKHARSFVCGKTKPISREPRF